MCSNARTEGQKTSKKTDREILRRIILGQLNRVFRDRYGAEFPDHEAGRPDLEVLLRYHALHPTHARENMRNTIETRAPWMPKAEADLVIGDLAILDQRRLWLSQAELRQQVWLSNADRQRLKAWNIPPWDRTPAQLELQRKERKLARKRLARRKAGAISRSIYLVDSISSKEPWKAEGVSRATWYRRMRQVRGQVLTVQLSNTVTRGDSQPPPSPAPVRQVRGLEEKVLSDPIPVSVSPERKRA